MSTTSYDVWCDQYNEPEKLTTYDAWKASAKCLLCDLIHQGIIRTEDIEEAWEVYFWVTGDMPDT